MSKVRNGERGRRGVERRLVALGARPRHEGEPGRAWLEEALRTVGARVVSHGGKPPLVRTVPTCCRLVDNAKGGCTEPLEIV
ncbi:hypothetical protein [Streptomyces sp. MK5]|uniref:hypothetical protein n=1 Tax=Streptomyces sp. MK5 TaxID=3064253 RepID=UPI0027419560|nr:hypothetical protein [Streptomyces sp. MK5]